MSKVVPVLSNNASKRLVHADTGSVSYSTKSGQDAGVSFSMKVLTQKPQDQQRMVSGMVNRRSSGGTAQKNSTQEEDDMAEMARIQEENKAILRTYVRLNPITLQFSDRALEKDYKVYYEEKRKYTIAAAFSLLIILGQFGISEQWVHLTTQGAIWSNSDMLPKLEFLVTVLCTIFCIIAYLAHFSNFAQRSINARNALEQQTETCVTVDTFGASTTDVGPPVWARAIKAVRLALPNDDVILCGTILLEVSFIMAAHSTNPPVGLTFSLIYAPMVLSRLSYVYSICLQAVLFAVYHIAVRPYFFSATSAGFIGAIICFTYAARVNELALRRDFRLTRRLAAENVDIRVDATTNAWFQLGLAKASPANRHDTISSPTGNGHLIKESDLVFGKTIGSGAFGEVMEGEWRGTPVAIKKIHGGPRQEAVMEFGREAALMSNLRHPCVVLYLGTCLKPLLVVMELMPRGSLYNILHKSKTFLDWSLRLRMLSDAARGMNFLHLLEDPIIHNDLKSLNLLVDNDWRCKVCDFGFSEMREMVKLESTATPTKSKESDDQPCEADAVAAAAAAGGGGGEKVNEEEQQAKENDQSEPSEKQEKVDVKESGKLKSTDTLARTKGNVATIGWASPEAIRNEELTEKNDIYAYAIVLFEMISYTLPFHSLTKEAIPLAVLDGKRPDNFIDMEATLAYMAEEPEAHRKAVKKLEGLMRKCWDADPAKRPSFKEILADLGKIMNVFFGSTDKTQEQIVFPNIIKSDGKEMGIDANSEAFTINPDELVMGPKIGSGAYGEVHEAVYHGTHVAVKQIHNSGMSPEILKEFNKECSLMLGLRHPNVVLFMGSYSNPPKLIIVTELLTRGSLYYTYNSNPKPSDKNHHLKLAYKITEGMALGLNYLHNHNPPIIHFDMKSPNVLLDEGWNAKIADFGLSKIREEGKVMTAVGSPLWAAPEVLRGEEMGFPCDVYSFAVVVWEIIAWEEPYPKMGPATIMRNVAYNNLRPKLTKDFPPDLKDLLQKCWRDDPKQRPTFDDIIKIIQKMQENLGNP